MISTEFRAKYAESLHPDGSSDWYRGLTVWSPNINIFRDPRWGRGQETYGEDPYLTSRLGLAFVTGLQGNDPKYLKTVATPKHFAVHSGPELTRHIVDVTASKHDMEDTYLPAFRATVMDGKAESVMCAYNSLNGQPACANDDLLKVHLRGDWGFHGYVVSDCAALEDVFSGHHYAKSMEEAVADAFNAGTDLVCGMPPQQRQKLEKDALVQAVQKGLLQERCWIRRCAGCSRRDSGSACSIRSLHGAVVQDHGRGERHGSASRSCRLQAARESIVLLKNADGFLPLKKKYGTIAVIGPNADSIDALVGNYNGTPSNPVTLLTGIQEKFPQSRVVYAVGTGLTGAATEPMPAQYLFTGPERKEHGLKAEYFSNPNLEGAPALSRVDAEVNFEWGYFGVTPQMVRNYSVRWNGVIVPPVSGDYLIGFTGEDGYRIWLDGQVVEDWTQHRPATTMTKQVHLEAGRAYPIKIDYFQLVRGAEARLIWSILGRAEREALEAARTADLVIVAMGLSPRVEGEEMKISAEGFAGGDRTKIVLPAPQERLLERSLCRE